jgi:hypothetical protein
MGGGVAHIYVLAVILSRHFKHQRLGNLNLTYLPPQNWQDFEKFIKGIVDLFQADGLPHTPNYYFTSP